MAVSPAAQPPKPPPPPKVEAKEVAAPQKQAAKPAEAPKAALRTPDTFEQPSGGRAQPFNGGSSFSSAVSNAFDRVSQAQQRAEGILSKAGAKVADATIPGISANYPKPPSIESGGWGGSQGPIQGQAERGPLFGGAAGGVGDHRVFSAPSSNFSLDPFQTLQGIQGFEPPQAVTSSPSFGSLEDLFSRNFNATPSGGGADLSFLDSRAGGGVNTFSFQFGGQDWGGRNDWGHGHHRGWYDFDSRGSGGGGAAGGVADRWER